LIEEHVGKCECKHGKADEYGIATLPSRAEEDE
jgi:hypothetical protein